MAKRSTTTTYKGNKRDQYIIVLEDIRSKFEIFGEGLELLSEKFDRMDQRMERLEFKVDIGFLELKSELKMHYQKLQNHEARITALENNA